MTGTVSAPLNFTVYQIDNPACTGFAFPGPGNRCIPQHALVTLTIPVGDYTGQPFTLTGFVECGPLQQDVYRGAYRPVVTGAGLGTVIRGSIGQFASCGGGQPSSPTPTPSLSVSATSPGGGGISPTAPSAPPTSNPVAPASGGVAGSSGELASTGPSHPTALLLCGCGALVAGVGFCGLGRRGQDAPRH